MVTMLFYIFNKYGINKIYIQFLSLHKMALAWIPPHKIARLSC